MFLSLLFWQKQQFKWTVSILRGKFSRDKLAWHPPPPFPMPKSLFPFTHILFTNKNEHFEKFFQAFKIEIVFCHLFNCWNGCFVSEGCLTCFNKELNMPHMHILRFTRDYWHKMHNSITVITWRHFWTARKTSKHKTKSEIVV